MRSYIIVFIHAVVLIKSFNTQDFKDPSDYNSEEESESGSNEIGTSGVKYNKYEDFVDFSNTTETVDNRNGIEVTTPIINIIDRRTIAVTKPHIVTKPTKSYDNINYVHPTRATETAPGTAKKNCHHHDGKSEEDRSSTTLINYPFSVSIQKKGAHYTTGALVDKRWILSTAAEFFNVRESIKLFRARLGSVDCKKGGTLVPLKRVELHPSYVYGQPNFDLSLLRMAQPVDYTDFIRPIGLSKIRTKVISAKFMTTYWPRLIVKGKILPANAQERIKQNSMRVSTQRLIPRGRCLASVTNVTLDESTLCLKPFVTHHSLCMPDSGAPVIAEDGLWGITSGWTSPDCRTNPSPTMFSRIASTLIRAWLDSQLLNIL